MQWWCTRAALTPPTPSPMALVCVRVLCVCVCVCVYVCMCVCVYRSSKACIWFPSRACGSRMAQESVERRLAALVGLFRAPPSRISRSL
jgi:hypothetical protein